MMPMPPIDHRPTGPNPNRSVRGRSFALALLLHVLVLAAFVYPGFQVSGHSHEPELQAVVHASLSPDRLPPAMAESGDDPRPDETPSDSHRSGAVAAAPALVVEPGEDLVRGIARKVLEATEEPPRSDALAELTRKAELLERVSNPQEVRRISLQVRQILGAPPPIAPGNPPHVGSFDYDAALVADAVRIERPGEVEIREKLIDPAGRSITISTVRREDSTNGGFSYERILIEQHSPPQRTPSDREAFEEALARQRPFEIINRFPLVRQIHDEAVLPILDMLSREEGPAAKPARAAAN